MTLPRIHVFGKFEITSSGSGFGAGGGEFGAEIGYLLLEGFDSGEERGLLELFDGPAPGDVLGAVPVEGGEVEDDYALGAGFAVDEELIFPGGGFVPRDDFDVSQHFQAGLVGVVHEEEGRPVVGAEIAGGDVLAVAGDVGEGEGCGRQRYGESQRDRRGTGCTASR